MKIGLITMHNVNNYGAVLQTYALYSQLEILGHECTIINYIPNVRRGIKVVFPPSNTPLIKKILSWIKWMPAHITRIKCFKEFQYKYYKNITQKYFYDTVKQCPSEFDIYITGSDQVWNSDSTMGLDPNYFLQFVSNQKKIISYAASLSAIDYSLNENILMAEYLKKFDAISIREALMLFEVSKLTTRSVVQTIDPTMLVGVDFWKSFISQQKNNIIGKYCLIYILGEDAKTVKYAQKKADDFSAKTVKISFLRRKVADIMIINPSPENVVKLFSEAEYVVTNSVHGILFSLIFNKNFTVPKNVVGGTRFKDLFNTYGLNVYSETEENLIHFSPDYFVINKKIKELRDSSLSFLKENVK